MDEETPDLAPAPSQGWTCAACTFLNSHGACCVVCYADRPGWSKDGLPAPALSQDAAEPTMVEQDAAEQRRLDDEAVTSRSQHDRLYARLQVTQVTCTHASHRL